MPIKDTHLPFIEKVRDQIKNNGKPYLLNEKHKGRKRYRVLIASQPSITLTTNPCVISTDAGMVHYAYNRMLTPREVGRLQGFPDTFTFTGGIRSALKQIGNAVPPPLAYVVAVQIMEAEKGSVNSNKRILDEIQVENDSPLKKRKF